MHLHVGVALLPLIALALASVAARSRAAWATVLLSLGVFQAEPLFVVALSIVLVAIAATLRWVLLAAMASALVIAIEARLGWPGIVTATAPALWPAFFGGALLFAQGGFMLVWLRRAPIASRRAGRALVALSFALPVAAWLLAGHLPMISYGGSLTMAMALLAGLAVRMHSQLSALSPKSA